MVFIPNLGTFHKLIIEASQKQGRNTLGNSQCGSHFHTLIFMPSAWGGVSFFSKYTLLIQVVVVCGFDLSTFVIL